MTGGGVYPAIAVLQALEGKVDEVLWIGSQSGMEETLLRGYKLAYQSIPAAGLHGVGLRSLPVNFSQLYRGWRQARTILSSFKPHVLFFTGGYLGVPVALAGRHIPTVVFVPDIEPGLALKTILRGAGSIAASCEAALTHLPRKRTIISGYPVRSELSRWQRSIARQHFGIPDQEKTLLVFGGSKGARSINQALLKNLPGLLKDMHIIHISGKDNWDTALSAQEVLPEGLRSRYHAFPFLHEDMGAAFAAADLAVCRSGASTLGELPLFGLPAILVPYPHAWRYQLQNAQYLAQHGGARVLHDHDLDQEMVVVIQDIINNTEGLERMRTAMKQMASPQAAEQIAELILTSGQTSKGEAKW